MVRAYLENTAVSELKSEYGVSALKKKYAEEKAAQKKVYDETKKALEEVNKAGIALLKVLEKGGENNFDYDMERVNGIRTSLEEKQQNAVEQGAIIKKENELLEKYGDSFARLYQIRDKEAKSGSDVRLELTEITTENPVGVLTQEKYYEMSANPNKQISQIALSVDLGEENKFTVSIMPYDKPGSDKKEIKAQLSFDEDALKKLNAERLTRITEFCEAHGMPTFQMDIPYSFDGNINVSEKLSDLLRQVKENERSQALAANEREYDEIEKQRAKQNDEAEELQTEGRDISEIPSPDVPPFEMDGERYDLADGNINRAVQQQAQTQSQPQTQQQAQTQSQPQTQQQAQPQQQAQTQPQAQASAPTQAQPQSVAPTKKEKTIKDAEEGIENFLEGGLKKNRNSSYFKTHTGWLGSGWTEYIVYDKEDPKNRKKDGKCDKSGEPKFTYSFKLFVLKDGDKFRFAYRTPDNKKIDEGVVNGLVGQFKDLGITHVSFPDGLADAEKKLWRIALAEKGIVPKGMGLDKAKAEGMLKAAKEKLSTEEFKKFRYRLALQMEKDNIAKGKVVSPSEQEFIESLKSSQKYLAFTDGYAGKLKSMLSDKLDAADTNKYDGALDKVALYKGMRRLFDVYKENVDNASLLDSGILNAEEKNKLRAAGLTGPVSEFNEAQMGELFEIMLPQSRKDAYEELDGALLSEKDTENRTSKGAKRADNIIIKEVFDGARNRFEKVNETLSSLGVEEISFPKLFGLLHYKDRFYAEHPQYLKKTQQNNNTNAQPTPKKVEQVATPKKENKTQLATMAAANQRSR